MKYLIRAALIAISLAAAAPMANAAALNNVPVAAGQDGTAAWVNG